MIFEENSCSVARLALKSENESFYRDTHRSNCAFFLRWIFPLVMGMQLSHTLHYWCYATWVKILIRLYVFILSSISFSMLKKHFIFSRLLSLTNFLQNETICDALINMKWYCLPLSKQKDVAHMLNRIQNGVVLTQV